MSGETAVSEGCTHVYSSSFSKTEKEDEYGLLSGGGIVAPKGGVLAAGRWLERCSMKRLRGEVTKNIDKQLTNQKILV